MVTKYKRRKFLMNNQNSEKQSFRTSSQTTAKSQKLAKKQGSRSQMKLYSRYANGDKLSYQNFRNCSQRVFIPLPILSKRIRKSTISRRYEISILHST